MSGSAHGRGRGHAATGLSSSFPGLPRNAQPTTFSFVCSSPLPRRPPCLPSSMLLGPAIATEVVRNRCHFSNSSLSLSLSLPLGLSFSLSFFSMKDGHNDEDGDSVE